MGSVGYIGCVTLDIFSIVHFRSIMPTTIETRMTISNEHVTSWHPDVKVVDGNTFIKLDCKDRCFFRFCTGKAITLGSKYENSKYLLQFWVDMVKARSDACQAAFEKMQAELREDAGNDDGDRNAKRHRVRCRKACNDDALTVGRIVKVEIKHRDACHTMKALFGVKTADLWVEAAAGNLNFIKDAMKCDYDSGNFAPTKPRGTFFRRSITCEDTAAEGGAPDGAHEDENHCSS
jgi:hypothetical protein